MKKLLKDVIYGSYDLVTGARGIDRNIGGERIRFPIRYSRYYQEDYEPLLFEFLRRHCLPGDTFLDCGAHFGLISVVASRIVGESGRVVSFEPSPDIRSILESVVRLNGCSNVSVRPEAVTDKAGTATFFETGADGSNANSLAKQGRHSQGTTVPTLAIDDVAAELEVIVHSMKVDVEGAEYGLLIGAERTIMSCRPSIFLSLHPMAIEKTGAAMSDIWNILQKYRFKLSHLGKGVEEDWFVRQTELFDVECLPD